MEMKSATEALGALAQETRLSAFRLLVRVGHGGAAAGEIASALGIPPATLSFHLAHLSRAGLVTSRRESRSIVYAANFDGMSALIDFLTEDCCQGHPQVCGARAGSGAASPQKTKSSKSRNALAEV